MSTLPQSLRSVFHLGERVPQNLCKLHSIRNDITKAQHQAIDLPPPGSVDYECLALATRLFAIQEICHIPRVRVCTLWSRVPLWSFARVCCHAVTVASCRKAPFDTHNGCVHIVVLIAYPKLGLGGISTNGTCVPPALLALLAPCRARLLRFTA